MKCRTHIPGFVRLATRTLILLKVRDLGSNASYGVSSLGQRFRIIVRARGRFPHLDIYFFVIQLLPNGASAARRKCCSSIIGGQLQFKFRYSTTRRCDRNFTSRPRIGATTGEFKPRTTRRKVMEGLLRERWICTVCYLKIW